MKVLLTFYGEDLTGADPTPERRKETFDAWAAFAEAAGDVLLAAEGLESPSVATTIRVGDGDRRVVDGPFMETKEQLAGFALLEVGDLDEALAWAARTPWNGKGHVTEVRPVMQSPARASAAS